MHRLVAGMLFLKNLNCEVDPGMNAFDRLCLTDKLKVIKLNGTFLVTIEQTRHTVSLYKIERTFVERYSDKGTGKTIRISSAEYRDLVKYLPHVTIPSIYNLIAQ
jgi:hypothetical protein